MGRVLWGRGPHVSTGVIVAMPVVQVRVVGVRMLHRRMMVPVGVRFARGGVRSMVVLVVFVMDMTVLVLKRLVNMLVFVLLGEVQVDAQAHQHSGKGELPGHRVTEQGQR